MARPQLKELSLDVVDDPKEPSRSAGGFGDMDALRDSILAVGIIEPLIVARRGQRFEVVAGHRRRLAAKMAGLVTVPCIVHDDFKSAEEAVMLHENIYRADLNPVDEARFYRRVGEKVGGDCDRIAELVKARREHVEARLMLLEGDERVLAALELGDIPIGVAEELNLYVNAEVRYSHLLIAVQGGSTTAMVRQWRKQQNEFERLKIASSPGMADPAPATPTVEQPTVFKCYYCGSAEFVETMEQVYIHKPCNSLLRSALQPRNRE